MKHIVPLHKIKESVRVFQSKNQHAISEGEKELKGSYHPVYLTFSF